MPLDLLLAEPIRFIFSAFLSAAQLIKSEKERRRGQAAVPEGLRGAVSLAEI